MKTRFPLKWISILILAAPVAYYFSTQKGKSPISAQVGAVNYSDLVQRVTIAGVVNANRKTIVTAPYNGYIRKLYVQVGDHVKAGDPIVSLTQSLKEDLHESFPLRAPFSGVVVQVLKAEGEFVDQAAQGGNPTNVIARVDDLSRLLIEANIPEMEVGKLRIGQEAIVKASAVLDHPYHGKIKNISLAARDQKDWDRSRVEFPALIEITDPDAHLKPGMSVIVDVITHQLNHVLTLRHEYVTKEREGYFMNTDKGLKKKIETGIQNEEIIEIKKGLEEGEKVRQIDLLSTLNPV